jgi:parallel beta-helix repeat protein
LYQSADNNEITNNTAISNTKYGIYISSSDYNIIYNNYFNNTNNAVDDGNNVWNTTKTLGTNIIGGQYLGGNYWSDYAGRDINGDGLGDTLLPHNSAGDITNDGDYHPLVPVGYAPFLSIEKTDNPDPVSPAGTLNYSIHVNNTGNATAHLLPIMTRGNSQRSMLARRDG